MQDSCELARSLFSTQRLKQSRPFLVIPVRGAVQQAAVSAPQRKRQCRPCNRKQSAPVALDECSTRISSAVSTQMCDSGGRGCRSSDQSKVRAGTAAVAASCRTGRKNPTQFNDATLSRGPIAKTGLTFRSVRGRATSGSPPIRTARKPTCRCVVSPTQGPPVDTM